ncbi:MAG: hypothetical protein ACI9XO_002278, partial [Paraglaciecola sp.]
KKKCSLHVVHGKLLYPIGYWYSVVPAKMRNDATTNQKRKSL